MTTLTTLPNLSRSAAVLKLLIDIRSKANDNTIMGMGIIKLIDSNKNHGEAVLVMIRNQVLKTPGLMKEIVGEELVKRLLNFE